MPTTPVLPVVALAVGFTRDRQSPAQAALLAEDQPCVDAEMVPTRWRGPGRNRHQQGCGRADRRGGTFGPDDRGVVTVIVVREVVDMAFLVAYASKHGATGGVAGRVAATRVRN